VGGGHKAIMTAQFEVAAGKVTELLTVPSPVVAEPIAASPEPVDGFLT
jgi:hypothetical protein